MPGDVRGLAPEMPDVAVGRGGDEFEVARFGTEGTFDDRRGVILGAEIDDPGTVPAPFGGIVAIVVSPVVTESTGLRVA